MWSFSTRGWENAISVNQLIADINNSSCFSQTCVCVKVTGTLYIHTSWLFRSLRACCHWALICFFCQTSSVPPTSEPLNRPSVSSCSHRPAHGCVDSISVISCHALGTCWQALNNSGGKSLLVQPTNHRALRDVSCNFWKAHCGNKFTFECI